MAKKLPSSPRKRTRKVDSPTPSTTSSTTARTSNRAERKKVDSTPAASPANSRSQSAKLNSDVLTQEQQREYRKLLANGGSPAGACLKMGIDLADVAVTMEQSELFCRELARVQELLSQNVAAALYRSAMEGSVSAQTFYLKNRPPPEWPDPSEDTSAALIGNLTDDELIAQFRKEAPAFLARLATRDPSAPGQTEAGPLSGSTQTSQRTGSIDGEPAATLAAE